MSNEPMEVCCSVGGQSVVATQLLSAVGIAMQAQERSAFLLPEQLCERTWLRSALSCPEELWMNGKIQIPDQNSQILISYAILLL